MSEFAFPQTVHEPAKTYRVCGMCPHHKCIGALHVRRGPGGYRDYACLHPKAWPEDHLVRRIYEEGRHIGKTEKTPEWCPLLRQGPDVEAAKRCRSCGRGDVRMGEVCGHCGDTNPLGVRELGMEEQNL